MKKIRILHLTIKYKWFKEIADGTKIYEFRKRKPYWTKRLFYNGTVVKEFDEIYIRNGYTLDRPVMRLKWHGLISNDYYYAIRVHDIIEIKNFEEIV